MEFVALTSLLATASSPLHDEEYVCAKRKVLGIEKVFKLRAKFSWPLRGRRISAAPIFKLLIAFDFN